MVRIGNCSRNFLIGNDRQTAFLNQVNQFGKADG